MGRRERWAAWRRGSIAIGIGRCQRSRKRCKRARGRALPSIWLVHLRRALLLFAIVLGLAAIAASVSRPREEPSERGSTSQSFPPSTERDEAPPSATPAPEPEFELAELNFDADRDQTRRVAPGPATVSVEVDQPGQVQIEDLGVSAAGDPLTPAIFDLFVSDSGRHEITFTPADGNESRSAGTLVVEPDPG